ncbi:hypothetical protein OCJ35_04935 [Pluralibacter gergoviae]|uniref:hypothetical protein n=1 Tax=Pluralibacter gergoviae TaxID=61647 RepID=UPI000FD71D89|nr:hypothetical protein [Pluralibacter gergoviae]MCK1069399.1 hypothetical protein [Pluralibacter gergoviae]MCV7757469.1 hypothetical protein [Pluralibacter gergoviae]
MKTIALIDPPHDLKKYEEWKSQWMDSDSISLSNYIGECCHPEDLLICSQLLIPSLVEVDGCVVMQERYQVDNFLEWKKHFPNDPQRIEKVLNNVVMYDVFLHTGNDVSNIIFEQLCNVIKISWELMLKKLFPNKRFNVEINFGNQDDGPSVTFYQK